MKKRMGSALSILLCLVLLVTTAGVYTDTMDGAKIDEEKIVEVVSAAESAVDRVLPLAVEKKELADVKEEEIDYDCQIVSAVSKEQDQSQTQVVKEEKEKTVLDELVASRLEESLTNGRVENSVKKTNHQKDQNETLFSSNVPFDLSHPEIFNSGEVEYASNTLQVKLATAYGSDVTTELKDAGIGKLVPVFEIGDYTWYTAYLLKDIKTEDAIAKVRKLEAVAVAEYSFVYEKTATDLDRIYTQNPEASRQWHLKSNGVDKAWEELDKASITPGGSRNVIVAVIDTGVDYTHEDLKDNIWVNPKETPDNYMDDDQNGYNDDYYGVNVVNGGSGMDDSGHGTHVAGIIAAANNDLGVVGIAYNTKIMPIKADDGGLFLPENITRGIMYAFENGADVINMSFGGTASSVQVQDALACAYSRCVLVAAAGNDGNPLGTADKYTSMPTYPAAYNCVLGVMSVDQNMTESGFTNWDTGTLGNMEYEVYAPGEQIVSTMPGNRYGSLSGTSMASPVVAAQAALLRSYYSDTDRYPTKFIYGQIVSTATTKVTCCDPAKHSVNTDTHHVTGCVNFYDSLVNLPKPDLGIVDYKIFDSVNFTEDTEGLAKDSEKYNNADGVVDAGEIIAFGVTIKNRWGLSKDSIVHLEVESAASQYVTVLNNDINLGAAGTYSEIDHGKIRDTDLWVGWKNPFYLKIAQDCPNDYPLNITLTVTCGNGLDEKDTQIYTSKPYTVTLQARRGKVLPNKITQDTTLTKDDYYIIPNSMIIMEGATLTIEAGAKVQFWCSDPEDAYANEAITYLTVAGKLICNGTEEEPIEMFPSSWMYNYRVEIQNTGSGYSEFNYVNILNPYLNVTKLNHCNISQNDGVGSYYHYRYLSEGKVQENSSNGQLSVQEMNGCNLYGLCRVSINATTAVKSTFYDLKRGSFNTVSAKECSFYKVSSGGSYYESYYCYGETYEKCAFVDCAIKHNASAYEECVFYGNSMVFLQDVTGGEKVENWETSSFTAQWTSNHFGVYSELLDAENGKLYILTDLSGKTSSLKPVLRFIQQLDGDYFVFETKKEFDYVTQRMSFANLEPAFYCNLRRDPVTKEFYGANGELVPEDIPTTSDYDYGYSSAYVSNGMLCPTYESVSSPCMFELNVPIYVTDIRLREYLTTIDLESTYQIYAAVTPSTVPVSALIYESEDPETATVDENGLVTPVKAGSTKIRVYAPDKAIYNYVTVNITEKVEPVSIEWKLDTSDIERGTTRQAKIVIEPANTTRRKFIFSSSDENVLKVSESGLVTAVGTGTATVKVEIDGYEEITDQKELNVIVTATGIQFEDDAYMTSMSKEDGKDFYPVFEPLDATTTELVWESSNPEICYVDEEGKLKKLKEGVATLRATIKDTKLTDSLQVVINNNAQDSPVVKMQIYDDYRFLLREDGSLWVWGKEYPVPFRLQFNSVNQVKDFCVDSYSQLSADSIFVVDEYGVLAKFNSDSGNLESFHRDTNVPELPEIVSLSEKGSSNLRNIYAINDEGEIYAYGANNFGQLGDDSTVSSYEAFRLMEFNGKAKKAVTGYGFVVVLDEEGKAYFAGGSSLRKHRLVEIASGVEDLVLSYLSESRIGLVDAEKVRWVNASQIIECENDIPHPGEIYEGFNRYASRFYIEDGRVYGKGYNEYGKLGIGSDAVDTDEYAQMQKVTNAVKVISNSSNAYIFTADGRVYGTGYGSNYYLGNGSKENTNIPVEIRFGLKDLEGSLELKNWNGKAQSTDGEDSVTYSLEDAKLVLEFNQEIITKTTLSDISLAKVLDENETNTSSSVSIKKTIDLHRLIIEPRNVLDSREKYRLTIPAGTLATRFGTENQSIQLEFTYNGPESMEPLPEDQTGEDTEKPGTENPDETEEEVQDIISDDEKLAQREYLNKEKILKLWSEYVSKGLNTTFHSNVILNRLRDDNPEHWMRIIAPNGMDGDSGQYRVISLGGNYWGTTDLELIQKQILDFDDYQSLPDINEGEILTEAPSDTFPFVVDAYLMLNDQEVDVVSNDLVTFVVVFNREMDTEIPLKVSFGSSYPYADYEISGAYDMNDAKVWRGSVQLNTLIESGYQYWSISNGRAAGTDMDFYTDWGRFQFTIDNSTAQSLIMQAEATDTGIKLTWEQDDFATLAGYNVYRSTTEDGYYTKLNKMVIPADTKEWFDGDVEPGQRYFYNFTVVESDMKESEPSGKINIVARDTMAPNIYHTPVFNAFAGINLVISATITDNMAVQSAKLYYRSVGATQWQSRAMDHFNDKYSAAISGAEITLAGIEYYIEAFDGVSYAYKGDAQQPFTVIVQEPVQEQALGDVDGNGIINLLDAMKILMAINDRVNLTAEEFARADIDGNGSLSAREALRVIQYINGSITSIKF